MDKETIESDETQKEIEVWFGLVWLCGPWILRSSDGTSHISGIPSSSPRGVEPPSTMQFELQATWD